MVLKGESSVKVETQPLYVFVWDEGSCDTIIIMENDGWIAVVFGSSGVVHDFSFSKIWGEASTF